MPILSLSMPNFLLPLFFLDVFEHLTHLIEDTHVRLCVYLDMRMDQVNWKV